MQKKVVTDMQYQLQGFNAFLDVMSEKTSIKLREKIKLIEIKYPKQKINSYRDHPNGDIPMYVNTAEQKDLMEKEITSFIFTECVSKDLDRNIYYVN